MLQILGNITITQSRTKLEHRHAFLDMRNKLLFFVLILTIITVSTVSISKVVGTYAQLELDISGATNLGQKEIADDSQKKKQKTSGPEFGLPESMANSCITEESASLTTYDMNCIYEKRAWMVMKSMTKDDSWIEGQATLVVFADYEVGWSGSILDSGFDSRSVGAIDTSTFENYSERIDKINFICEKAGTYSVVVQADKVNMSFFGAVILEDGKMLDLAFMDQDYGILSFTGNCA